jgi:signal peptidase I
MQQRAQGKPVAEYFDRSGLSQLGVCPNCRARFPLSDDLRIADGDKFLVDKLGRVRRWAPVVFKFPAQIETTYVHRLVGLPGETVEIAGGDIFINGRREAKPFGVAHELWVLVNDTRYRPADLQPADPQWQPEETALHWQQAGSNWKFSGADAEWETLVFSAPLTDESYYAERSSEDPDSSVFGDPQPIGDVQITCTLAHFSGTGAVGFHWKYQGLDAVATITAGGVVDLHSGSETSQGRLTRPLSSVRTVGFAIRDRIGILFADGGEVTQLVIGPQDIEGAREALNGASEPCQIAITADHCDVELSRILLERDVHYRSGTDRTGCTGHAIVLGAHEHYVLGDHSSRANDSRLWQGADERLGNRYQAGTVPTELMIGTARCIYWPPRRWREFR